MRFRNRLLMRMNALIRTHVFSRPRFVRWMFGIGVSAPPDLQSYCEWPTIFLRLLVGRYMRADSNVLDLGTGAHAILAIHIQQQWPHAQVTATDIVPDRVDCARRAIAANDVQVRCIQSDLFENVDEQYDLILIVPPQTRTAELVAMGYQPISPGSFDAPGCWESDGGMDGLDVIRPFLKDCPCYLKKGGRVLLAISGIFESRDRLPRLISQAGLRIERVRGLASITSIYVLSRVQDTRISDLEIEHAREHRKPTGFGSAQNV